MTGSGRDQRLSIALGFEAGLQASSGISRYARDLYEGLLNHDEVAEVRRFANFTWLGDDKRGPKSAGALRSRRALDYANAVMEAVPGGGRARRWLRDCKSHRFLDPAPVSLYHEPNFIPRATTHRTVMTVHDLGYALYPQFHPQDRVAHLKRELPKALARADHVITISELVRRQLVATFGLDPAKITVVPIGLNSIFRVMPETECGETLLRHGLKWKRFMLAVGTLEPRKNLDGLLRGVRALDPAVAREYPLVVVGGGGWHNAGLKTDLDLAARDGLAVLTGTIDDASLARLYSAARGVLFASHYEGQGLPAIEAAACGAPVLTSTASAMAEQLGDLALYCDPQDDHEIARGIMRLVADDACGQRALRSASRIIDTCSVARSVDATVAVYRRVCRTNS